MATEDSAPGKSSASEDQDANGDGQRTPLFPVVGIGASAGGLEAFRLLLKALPADTGMAFVLVQHLAPDHQSQLSQLLASWTGMPVREASENTLIEPNHVYVIPPDRNIGILHDTLQLLPREQEAGRYLPVDWFLRTLAEDRGSAAIGVILSGTASDGTLGLRAIKAAGGITFAQDEASSQYFGMPGNAISAGHVDFVLAPADIGREIGRIAKHPYLHLENQSERQETEFDDHLKKLLLLLRSRCGHDFSYYKPTTIKRRILRRMAMHRLERLPDYIRYIERFPEELEQLFQDVLINVTSFFRDPETFVALQKTVLPRLLDDRPPGAQLRVWVAGCSTGEEVYSLAITLVEFLGDRLAKTPVQIFATDIDAQAIDIARRCTYPERIADEVSAGRLQRFFTKVSGGYQVAKRLRDMCLFAEQNVTRDPPFSKMDLICCRNLMIYLGPSLQKKVLEVFHYALQPNGYLMLGTSETIGRHADLFRQVDGKSKIYSKKAINATINYEFAPRAAFPELPTEPPQSMNKNLTLNELSTQAEQTILQRYAPPGVIINNNLDIVHFRGETGPYLNPSPGSASLNLLKLARKELVMALHTAVHTASRENTAVRKEGIRFRANGDDQMVDLQVLPLDGSYADERCLLVLFEERKLCPTPDSVAAQTAQTLDEPGQIEGLVQELATAREYMQSIIEDKETANEELQSSNEEIQSANEELQSTNEELETAKEELQSTNEELITLNEELEMRNVQLGAANNDFSNLLASVNLPILMLGLDLQIRQFNPQAGRMFNLIDSDLGRPIGQLRPNIEIPGLEEKICHVIDSMTALSLEVRDLKGHWFNLRVRPYRTLDNRIDGAVLTFIDIDDIKDVENLRRLQAALLESEGRLKAIIENSTTAIFYKDLHGRYQLANQAVAAMLGVSSDRILGRTDHELLPLEYAEITSGNDQTVIRSGKAMAYEEVMPGEGDKPQVYLSMKFPLKHADGACYALGAVATNITTRREMEEKMLRLATVVRDSSDAVTVLDFNGVIQAWNPAAASLYGWTEGEAVGMNVRQITPESELPDMQQVLARLQAGKPCEPRQVKRITKSGEQIVVQWSVSLLKDDKNSPKAVASSERRIG